MLNPWVSAELLPAPYVRSEECPTRSSQMKLIKSLAIIFAVLSATGGAIAAPSANAPGQSRDCLITWRTVADAQAGADLTAVSGKYLPRKAAQAQAAASGGMAKVFDYSNSTQTTTSGTQVTISSNDDEKAFCEGPEFNH